MLGGVRKARSTQRRKGNRARSRFWKSVVLGAIALVAGSPWFAAAQLPRYLPPETIGPTAKNIDPKQPIVETSGEGIAHALPDVVQVSFWANARARSKAQCSAAASSIAERAVAAEKAILGRDAEISTGYTQLAPIFATPSPSATPTATPARLGWKFEARVRASADSVAVMPALVEAGLAGGASEVVASGFETFSRTQSGEDYGRGNMFVPGKNLGRPLPGETRIPYVILSVDAEGETADQCIHKGTPIARHVAKVLADKLGSHGASAIWGFEVRRMEPQPVYMPRNPAKAVQQGFSAEKSIAVTTRELDKLPSILEAGYAAGAVNASVGFSLTVKSRARNNAISRALNDAHDKAEAVARAMHMRLGKVYRVVIQTSLQPNYTYSPPLSDPRPITKVRTEADSAERMPVAVRANVSVIYLLQ